MNGQRQGIIMIMGLPRSGTTWLGKIFDSHPDTVYRHEPDTVHRRPDVPYRIPVQDAGMHAEVLRSFVDELMHIRVTRVSAKTPWFRKSYYGSVRWSLRWPLMAFCKLASRAFGEITVPDLIPRKERGRVRFVWKSIDSSWRMGAMLKVIPGATAIAIIRHPCGNIASILRGEANARFRSKVPAAEDYGIFEILAETAAGRARGLTKEALRAMQPIERLAWRWLITNEQLMLDTKGLDNCRIVRYEDLCERPREISQDLFRFAGLAWNPQTDRFIEESTARDRESYYSVFKDPRHSATKWRGELAAEDIQRVLEIVGDSCPGRLTS